MVSVVSAGAVDEFYVIVSEFEGCVHLFVSKGPVTMLIVKVAAAVL